MEQWVVGREFRKRLKRAFDAERIEIPFPQRTLWVREGKAAGAGPRALPGPEQGEAADGGGEE
jgi:small conductance mechanosensitive channel